MGRAGRLGRISVWCGGNPGARLWELLCCAAVGMLCFACRCKACICCAEQVQWFPAELFTWASGRQISKDEAMRCAKREPGRSWEAIESELTKLGVAPALSLSLRQT